MITAGLPQTSNFTIKHLDLKSCNPTLYSCCDLQEPDYSVECYSSEVMVTVSKRTKTLKVPSDDLRRIRHEIVADVMRYGSDQPFSVIGITGEDGQLTPDFINIDKKTVLELATTAISDKSSLENAYHGKFVKYNYIVEQTDYSLFILVVSTSLILANFEVSQDVVDCLCYRMRVGLAVESEISEELGSDIFSEDLSSYETLVKGVFRSLKVNTVSSDEFDVESILSTMEGCNDSDIDFIGKVLSKALKRSKTRSKESEDDLNKYIAKFENYSRTTFKRVCNIPIVTQCEIFKPGDEVELDPFEATGMPLFLKRIWFASIGHEYNESDKQKQLDEAMGYVKVERHRAQRSMAFCCRRDLTVQDKKEAAKTGLWAKLTNPDPELDLKLEEDKKSFHPTRTNTEDIETFIEMRTLMCFTDCTVSEQIFRLLEKGKSLWNPEGSFSLEVLKEACSTLIVNFGQTVSNLMSEICYSLKYWLKRADFYHKRIGGVHMLVRCTGLHVFVMFAYSKKSCKAFDPGHIGPRLWESPNYIFSDVCSFTEAVIEHFVKAGPYIASMICHLFSHLEMRLDNLDLDDDVLTQHVNNLVLLYLNNKTDSEELVTSQRYLTMGILEELDPNPYRFVERLPEVLRSRLTCHYVKKTIEHMRYYSTNRVMKYPKSTTEEYDITISGLKSLFSSYEPNFKQKVNEFYFGYVVSKEKGRGNDRTFKILKKIVNEEYRYRDTITKTFSEGEEPKIHVSDIRVIRVFCAYFKRYLKRTLGKNYMAAINMEVLRSLAKCSFEDLATLKVSARDYEEKIVIPTVKHELKTSQLKELYEKNNPNEVQKRPRTMEALKLLIDEFIKVKKTSPKHPIELLPYCLEDIDRRGYWDSDIFPKSQHGGDREIHVLEIKMRVIQYFVECISKSLCKLVQSDTLTHPHEKETFVRRHYKEASGMFETSFTLGKSADATKWCQRNDSSKFAAVLCPFVPEMVRPFFIHVMSLWKQKRFSFPIQFAAIFLNNKKTKSNPLFDRMRQECYSGKGIFYQALSNKIIIKSGMMQGILHYTSSFTHAVIQEVMKMIQIEYLKTRGIKCHITVVQGSDDSAELLTIGGSPSKNLVRLATTMLHWKEIMSEHFSIYTSRAKSSIGTLDIVEYNSEWSIRTTTIKPTFRWASACLETTLTERFIDRIRINHNVCSQVLEGGGKILEVAMIQLCQAWMHYLLIGLHTSSLAKEMTDKMLEMTDPSLGFYPLDSDYIAGVTGVEFQIFKLVKDTEYGRGLSFVSINMHTTRVTRPDSENKEDEELDDMSVGVALRSVLIKFSDAKLWKDQVRRMNVPDLKTIVQKVEENPYLIYGHQKSWEDAKFAIFLKMFQPGVKETLSSHSAATRMMSASAYMINRPCVSIRYNGQNQKFSLFKACSLVLLQNMGKKKLTLKEMFVHASEYMEVLSFIQELEMNSSLSDASLKTRNKQKVCVFERTVDAVPIIDLCKKKWFNLGILPLSKRQILRFWMESKTKYPFIKDDRAETKELLGMNEIELKNFLQSLVSKPRDISLLDTNARSVSLYNSITRVFWNGVKVMIRNRKDTEESSFELRSKLFCVVTSWYGKSKKKALVEDMILSCEMLNDQSVPPRLEMIKVLHMWFKTRNKHEVFDYLERNRMGTLGFFIKRQAGFGRGRKGTGEWRGKVTDISVIVTMEDGVCTGIQVNRLGDLKALGKSLLEMINSFYLKFPERNQGSNHWLLQTGQIIGGHGKSTGIPIDIDPELDVSIVDKIMNYNWDWMIERGRVKLIAEYERYKKIVILSVPFTHRDWDQSITIPNDVLLEHWSSGKSLATEIIEKEFKSMFGFENEAVKRAVKNRWRYYSTGQWCLADFYEAASKLLFSKSKFGESDESQEDENEEEDISVQMSEQEKAFEEMMKAINRGGQEYDVSDIGVFKDDDDYAPDLFELDSHLIDHINRQLPLFQFNMFVDYTDHKDPTSMPRTNMCLNGINNLCQIVLGCRTFEEATSMFKSDETKTTSGLLGVLLTMFTGRGCLPIAGQKRKRAENTNFDAITMMVADSRNAYDLENEEIEQQISQMEGSQFTFGEEEYPVLEAYLGKLRRIRDERARFSSSDNQLSSYGLHEVINCLKPHLLKHKLVPASYSYHRDRQFVDAIRCELCFAVDNKLNERTLTVDEHLLYRESIERDHLTPYLLDALGFRFDIEVSCCEYSGAGEGIKFVVTKSHNKVSVNEL